jgi:all-trans-8'-apo-beta-carotenal 15,15'-oxygenase
VHPQKNGVRSRYLLSASGSDRPYFHAIQMRDLDSGRLQRFDYGAGHVAEEHLFVPRPNATHELDAWLLGTTFDTARGVTVLNVLDARRIGDGPIAQARLPYALPYGFHGNFTAA